MFAAGTTFIASAYARFPRAGGTAKFVLFVVLVEASIRRAPTRHSLFLPTPQTRASSGSMKYGFQFACISCVYLSTLSIFSTKRVRKTAKCTPRPSVCLVQGSVPYHPALRGCSFIVSLSLSLSQFIYSSFFMS